MSDTYREWLPKFAPTWLQAQWGAAMLATIGGELDDQRELMTAATRARFPGDAPADALPRIGDDRLLERGSGESDLAYAARLIAAWDAWALAGSRRAILLQLKIAGFTGMYLMQRNGRRSSLDGSDNLVMTPGPGWAWDYRGPEWFNQFGVVFGVDVPSLTYVSGVLSDDATKLNRIVHRWKQGRAMFMGTWILESGQLWGWPLSRTWGGVGVLWGSGVSRFIPPR